jgi:hypothetical protein
MSTLPAENPGHDPGHKETLSIPRGKSKEFEARMRAGHATCALRTYAHDDTCTHR